MSYDQSSNSRWLIDRARKMGLSYEEAQAMSKKWLGSEMPRSSYAMQHSDIKMTDDAPPNSIRGER